ncbi:MAG: flagellar hook-associated protein FlgK [Pseudomonadota bacterium]
MPDFLNTALTGLLTFQRSLAVTSHNIANVNTPGYSRQRPDLAALPAQRTGQGFIGQGVEINQISRVSDGFLNTQLQVSLSEQNRLEAFESLASRIDNLLADDSIGLNSATREFFAGLQALADNPSSANARQVVLSQADVLVNRFSTLQSRLNGAQDEVQGRLQGAVDDVNALAVSIADLNQSIVESTSAAGGQPPNDLLDQRDALINQLSELVSVRTVIQSDGSMNVFIGSGQPLVAGLQFNQLSLSDGEFGQGFPEIRLGGALGGGLVTPSVSGGLIGGLLDFQRELLLPAQNTLGQTAVALALEFNDQHRLGVDLQGALGGDFFALDPPLVANSFNNTGSATVTASYGNAADLVAADYVLSFDGANYSLTRTDTGAPVAFTGTGTAADPIIANGISIEVGAGIAAGDRFLVRPTQNAAAAIERVINDTNRVAAAAPVTTSIRSINLGNATIEFEEVLDINDSNLLTTTTIDFITDTTYSINGAGSFAYTSGAPIDVNGVRVSVSGTPVAGDQFLVQPNSAGVGDNRNALFLAEVTSRPTLNGGSLSIEEGYGQLVTRVGTLTRQTQVNLEAQSAITNQAEQAQLAVSGVNLDEEAANLVRYQQAYQAAAQLISVADTLFQTILSSVRS